MTRTLNDCPAPAKLNLFLHVIGRRPDGYHLLQSAFQLLDHGDTLHFATRADGSIRRASALPGVAEQDDLTVRAARLLQNAAAPRLGRLPGAEIAIEKRLPMGGGLGGGSSDAATTLIALNHLWQAGFSRAELMALGLQLGADVPFFLFGRNAFAEGVGEALSALDDTPQRSYVVIEPGVAVPTVEIFRARNLTRDSKPVKMSDFSRGPDGFGKNDLQAVASALYPQIGQAIAWLSTHGEARMTGSGACVFCSFAEQHEAERVAAAVPEGWTAWTARGIARHPLVHLLDD